MATCPANPQSAALDLWGTPAPPELCLTSPQDTWELPTAHQPTPRMQEEKGSVSPPLCARAAATTLEPEDDHTAWRHTA